jgi:hypothetical protein
MCFANSTLGSKVRMLVKAAAIAAALLPSAGSAQPEPLVAHSYELISEPPRMWSTLGSAGTVDESDQALYSTSGANLSILSTVLSGDVVARYNITDSGLDVGANDYGGGGGTWKLQADFSVNAPSFTTCTTKSDCATSQVIVSLREYDALTGVYTTIGTINSASYSVTSRQRRTLTLGQSFEFDFTSKVYFLEVTLRKTLSGAPSFSGARIVRISYIAG